MFKEILRTNGKMWSPLALRIALGLIFMAHGGQKLFGWCGGEGLQGSGRFFQDTLGLSPGIFWATAAGLAEFLGGAAVFIGGFTRFGAVLIAAVMIVAELKVHRGFFLPNGNEYVLALLAGAASLLMTGGGIASIDAKLVKWLETPAAPPPTGASVPRTPEMAQR